MNDIEIAQQTEMEPIVDVAHKVGLTEDDLESFLVSLQALPSIASSILSVLLMAIFLVTPYTDFKWAIQNGISRKTLWQGRILSLFLMTLVVWFIAQLVGLMNTPFDLVSAWHSLLWYFGFSLTMMAIGNGFALLNRRWKWIVGIGLPMACLVLLMMLTYSNGKYEINWQDLEEKLANPLTTLMVFCNPHNPPGIVWKKREVERISSLCQENNVILLSDEIHGDLVRNNVKYTPAFSILRSNVISLVSPSKTFNVAALHAATVIIPDNNLRDIINRGLNIDELAEPNLLAIPATIAAYTEGFNWLHELLAVIDNNFAYVEKKITSQLENVEISSGPATYLMWLDVSKIYS